MCESSTCRLEWFQVPTAVSMHKSPFLYNCHLQIFSIGTAKSSDYVKILNLEGSMKLKVMDGQTSIDLMKRCTLVDKDKRYSFNEYCLSNSRRTKRKNPTAISAISLAKRSLFNPQVSAASKPHSMHLVVRRHSNISILAYFPWGDCRQGRPFREKIVRRQVNF
jgi:hypothetical protein